MATKYAIGIDYGTESGRVLIADVQTGEEISVSVVPYRHGVITEVLPDGSRLGIDWALQHPNDYLDVLYQGIPHALAECKAAPGDIIGIGIDFTACTVLPVDKNLEPLCFDTKWSSHPHSFVKLWKHHAAQPEATELTAAAAKHQEAFLRRYGGKISSEWLVPKLLQIAKEDPAVFAATDLFLEAGDWITYQLTKKLVKSSGSAGFKALWHKRTGYPSQDFFRALKPAFQDILLTKMRGPVVSLGSKAGELTEDSAKRLGLLPGTAVAVGAIDAHAAVPAVGAVSAGQLVMAMGTSTCHMFLAHEEKNIEGICGVVEDGLIPDLFGYEAGQVAVGDIFAWYVNNYISDKIKAAAALDGLSLHEWLEQKASSSRPGQSGLLALDWWNGCRSVLVNADLSGLILGLTLSTKPEEIYRALLEATAFGTRRIIENFVAAGLNVTEIFACGGLPQKNKLLMQIYADVTGCEIKIAASTQTAALGAAMFGAVAAGSKKGGYDAIFEAAKYMARVKPETYRPNPQNVPVYNQLYHEYVKLHDYFGRGQNDTMNILKKLRTTTEV